MDSYQSDTHRENMTEGGSFVNNITIEERDEEISSWRISDAHQETEVMPKAWMSERDIESIDDREDLSPTHPFQEISEIKQINKLKLY
jgi:hypothetical protein